MKDDQDDDGVPPAGPPAPDAERDAAGRPAQAYGDELLIGRTQIPIQIFLRKDRGEKPQAELDPDKRDLYLVELNVTHRGGLKAAEARFRKLYEQLISDGDRRPLLRVSKTYYRCDISLNEARKLTELDEQGKAKERAIYRIWPDFPVKALIDRSTATIKADAAFRSYMASGSGITWAVIDSGIDARHPHFGQLPPPKGDLTDHLLLNEDVIELHRDYSNPLLEDPDVDPSPAVDPNVDPAAAEARRQTLVGKHVKGALTDELGHGTHVAGIIAGGLPERDAGIEVRVFERKLEMDAQGRRKTDSIVERRPENGEPSRLRGVAPRCRLVSLKVIDGENSGRSSDVIRALNYIREDLNNNPRLVRVHGVNLSVGYDFDAEMFACGQSPLCVEVDRLVQAGVVVVAAAGNTGFGQVASIERSTTVGLSNTINDPGNAELAITVGATHRDAPHTYGVSYFSSKGPTGDGRLKPDVVAPGERITSCATGGLLRKIQDGLATAGQARLAMPPPGSQVGDALAAATQGGPGPVPVQGASQAAAGQGAPEAAAGQAAAAAVPVPAAGQAAAQAPAAAPPAPPVAAYLDQNGTSMAAPHVSGAIAAFLSIRPEFVGKPLEVKRIFLDSAMPLGRERYFEGRGLLDLMRAIQSV
jgi:subtilisin family serine protease